MINILLNNGYSLEIIFSTIKNRKTLSNNNNLHDNRNYTLIILSQKSISLYPTLTIFLKNSSLLVLNMILILLTNLRM